MGRLTMPEQVVREVQRILIRACKEVQGSGKISNDKLKTLSQLLSAYHKLLEVGGEGKEREKPLTLEEMFEHGDPDYYDRMAGIKK